MKLEILQSAKTEAMKNKDAIRKEAISAMIDAVQKASITPKGRIEITEQLTDEVLIKMVSPLSPISIMPVKGDNFTFIVLPVKIR